MTAPRVSVVMPVLAPHPVYFPAAVASVLAQTMSDLELVIVEDPSDCDGRELLRGIADDRIVHIRNPERTSLVDQRNRALAEARGEFVAMLDADDLAEPHRLRAQLDYFAAHPELGVLGSQLAIIDEHDAQLGTRDYPLAHEAIARAMRRYNAIAQPAVMARRAALREAGDYQYRTYPVNEDYELWSRLAARGVRLANHPERLVRYRIHGGSTKALQLHRMVRATIDVKQRYWLAQMTTGDRARLYAEHALLQLPASWVLKLFVLTQYVRR